MNEFKLAFINYVNFEGRAPRREYWIFKLFYYIILMLLISLIFIHEELKNIALIYFALCLIPNLSIAVRRLHDINKSGWYLLLYFVPLGSLVILIFTCTESDSNENEWGKPPYVQVANSF